MARRGHSKAHRNLSLKLNKSTKQRSNGDQPLFVLIDGYTSYRVEYQHSVRWQQAITICRADVIKHGRVSVARLRPHLALRSSKLADNGEPQLRNVRPETIWRENNGCPTGKISDRLWAYDADFHYTFEDIVRAKAEREAAIHEETLSWGLPEVDRGVVVAEDWGGFGFVDYREPA